VFYCRRINTEYFPNIDIPEKERATLLQFFLLLADSVW